MDAASTTGTTGRGWLRVAVDVVTAGLPLLVVLLLPRVGRPGADGPGETAAVVAAALLVGVALLTGRRRPVAVLALCLVVTVAVMLVTGAPTAVVLSVVVALYGVAVRRPVKTAVVAWFASTAAVFAAELATGGYDERVLAPVAVLAAGAAVGVAVAKQRELVRSAQERAAVAERTREEEAARRVTAERLRIARELHDVVAHHVAVMGVHAGVAGHLLDADPEQAREALVQVRSAGRTALAELGAVVGLLREPGDERLAAPAPGLAQLPELVATMRRSGLRVELTDGDGDGAALAGTLDELSDITAYRIVQESLTNALRHGTGTADLLVAQEGGAVRLRVSNPVAGGRSSSSSAGSGHGLVGMRERAVLVGADVSAGPTGDGRFEVRLRLPVRAGSARTVEAAR